MIDDDLDALLLGVLELPVRGLEELPRLARDDLDALGAEPQRAAAAIHRRVADADDEHALADRLDVAECDRAEPIDADVDAIADIAPRQAQILALRRAAADEHGVVALVEQRAQARDRRRQTHVDAETRDVADLLVEHLGRQAKGRNVRAHEPAGTIERFEDHALVAQRREIVRDRQRRAAGSDQRDAAAVLAFDAAAAAASRCHLDNPPRRASSGKSRRASPRRARGGTRARTAGRKRGRGCRGRRSIRGSADRRLRIGLARRAGCTPERRCAPGRPTGNRLRGENTRFRGCR